MSQSLCRECRRLVSELAGACPHCGIPRPVEHGSGLTLRPYFSAFGVGLVLVGLGGLWFRYQVGLLEGGPAVATPMARVDPHPGFQLAGQRIWLGAPLFTREGLTYAGRVVSLSCPGRPPVQGRVACLQIELANGHRRWLEWSSVEDHYLTPRPS